MTDWGYEFFSLVRFAHSWEILSAREDESPRGHVISSIYPARTGTNFPYFQLARRSFRFPSQLISQCNFSQLAQILHEERVFCRAAPLGSFENNRWLHIVEKITKNLTTLNNLRNSIHKLQGKPYREMKNPIFGLWIYLSLRLFKTRPKHNPAQIGISP